MKLYYKGGEPKLIQVEDLPDQRYFDYTKREAIRHYRKKFDLVGKHLQEVKVSASFFGYLN